MEKQQFDEFLGGDVQLPREVQICKLATARAAEIAAMTYSIENPQQTKLIFQKLPVHMRRRVMSHNAKRMPRRLREAHLNQMTKSGLPPKSKRQSRKYRRRPRNLLAEYNRRKRKFKWLETHIWHAKRFHMIEKWGCKIANFPNDKSFRACYRATAKHCLLQDMSYYACLELAGPYETLVGILKMHCAPGQLSFAAKVYQRGEREGKLMFYKKNGYPRSPVGNIKFLWNPSITETRKLWMWIHPMIYKDFHKEIVSSFDFRKKPEIKDVEDVEGSSGSDENNEKTPEIYENDQNCSMTNLSDYLNRFRLTGPLSLAILTDALKLPKLTSDLDSLNRTEKENNVPMEIDSPTSLASKWQESFYQNAENMKAFLVQKDLMEALRTLKSPDQLPPNIVMAMTVLDPRFFLPKKRTKALGNGEYYVKISTPPTLANQSPLWNSELRKEVKDSFVTTADISNLRSQNLIPGVENDDKYNEKVISKVPVIFIQNPGCHDSRKIIGFTSGIDVIIPAGWSMPFWQSCTWRCARAGGLRESRSMALESLDVNSPETHQPDISSHAEEAMAARAELRTKYFRYPPNRRINFTKFAISSPFYCEWKILMREWTDTEDFYVLRDRKLLDILKNASSKKSVRGKNKNTNGKKMILEKSKKTEYLDENIFTDRNCLVPVKISLEGKGRPRNFALICTPTCSDLETRQSKKDWSGPVQKLVADPNERERRKLRKNHKLMLKRAKKRGYRSRKLAQEAADVLKLRKIKGKSSRRLVEKNYALKKNYREKMEELYLPECQKVRESCDREVMGYVTLGGFSFTEARGIGMGYVTLDSFFRIVKMDTDVILVRNTQTRQYRFAKIEVLNPYG